jgi:hypothetical protein
MVNVLAEKIVFKELESRAVMPEKGNSQQVKRKKLQQYPFSFPHLCKIVALFFI